MKPPTATLPSCWWLPTTPYTALDALHRAEAATTSNLRMALLARTASYNGHKYHIVEAARLAARYNVYHRWGVTVFAARGVTFAEALSAATAAVHDGGRGASAHMDVRIGAAEAEQCRCAGWRPYTAEAVQVHFDTTMPWQCGARPAATGTTIGYAFDALRRERERGIPTRLFVVATDHADWEARCADWKAP